MQPGQIFESISAVFEKAMYQINTGLYNGAHTVFNNDFFSSALGLSIVFIGYMIAFRKIKDEEIAYKMIWTLTIFSVVHTVLYNKSWFEYIIEVVDLPREAFLSLIKTVVLSANQEASIGNVINRISQANISLSNYLYDIGGATNLMPMIYGILTFITGTFLLLAILVMSIFSIFLSNVALSLLPFILPFLVWKKTEYIFFNWTKLYISISLYAPFTLLLGLVSIETANLSIQTLNTIQQDFNKSTIYILSLMLMQILTALAIFKIPNLINQVIGSSNEGTSLTSGVGTISAGAAALGAAAKYSGLNIAGNVAKKGAVKAGGAVANRASDYMKNRIKMR